METLIIVALFSVGAYYALSVILELLKLLFKALALIIFGTSGLSKLWPGHQGGLWGGY